MAMYQAVMFDLDGTLVNTLDDLAGSVNRVLRQLGRPTHPVDRYRYFVGQGLRQLMTAALGPEHLDLLPNALAMFHEDYPHHMYEHSRPYPGIDDLLSALTQRGLRLAVLSNKPHDAAVTMVQHFFPDVRFEQVQGQADDKPRKPDPAAALQIARQMRIETGRWLYVGDSAVDMQTATAAGFFAVGVTWGFRSEQELRDHDADAIIHEPMQLLRLLNDEHGVQ